MSIDTTPQWDRQAGYQTLGVCVSSGVFYGTTAIGQVFSAGSETTLTAINFYLAKATSSDVNYQVCVSLWSNQQPTGSPVFQSGTLSSASLNLYDPSAPAYTEVAVNMSGTVIEGGASYIAFLTTLGLSQTGTTGLLVGAVYESIGGIWFSTNPSVAPTMQFGDLSAPWANAGDRYAFAITINF